MANKTPIVAIVGRTNVGKSSFYNAVLERREAIVAREAGTTRDSLIAKAYWKDQEFWLVDTAGLKDPVDDFEVTIQEQIAQAAETADVILVMVEADVPMTDDDRKLADMALRSHKPVVLVINKIDKVKRPSAIDHFTKVGINDYSLISVSQKRGIAELLDKIVKLSPHPASKKAGVKVIKLALIGRPNVGKSYLFNSLAKKQQALVSDRAGTTRDVNRTVVKYKSNNIELMDTAGIRRPGKIELGVEKFSVMRTLSAIEQADICILVMDVNELNVQLDQKLAGLIKEAGKGLILCVAKWDSADKDPFTRDRLAPVIAHEFAFVPWAPLIFTSAITGQNVTKLFDLTLEIVTRRKQTIPTKVLNNWLGAATSKLVPAGLKNRTPKLNYATQETDNPTPSFKIFGAQTKYIHWSYRRYLERNLRENFDFDGTPVELWFIEKHVAHRHGHSPTKAKLDEKTNV